MNISYNWLKKYVATELPATEVAKLLTDVGLEVEHIEQYESLKGGLEGLVVGEVKTCIKHPNADKLSLTTVDVGTGTLLNIVCGAPNVAAGQKVIVALEGSKLYPSTGEPFVIKKSKIRGEYSEGMICAEDEIGLGTSHAGVMVLPNETIIGTPASEYFKIYKDTIFEIGITPNRADALSHIGVSRDLVAIINIKSLTDGRTKLSLKLPVIRETDHAIGSSINIRVENPDACKRYTGVELKGIEVKESPLWLKNCLSAVGMRPINNIVDITNYVMLETGQPLHAFDADKIKGHHIIVRNAKQGETLTTLDGTERKLMEDDLLICNEKEAMCIAGVYGGIESGVTSETKNIFLESACFDATYIRRSAKHHDLHTDASYRFERGTDANNTLYALMRAVDLMREENPEIKVSGVQDGYLVKSERMKIYFSCSHAQRLIGYDINPERMGDILEAAGIKILDVKDDVWELSIPTYRMDITNAADVVEEILRFYGYNNIPIPPKLSIPLVHSGKNVSDEIRDKVGDFLSSLGFTEIMNTSLTSSVFGEDAGEVKIANPLSSDLDVLRGTMLYNGLTCISFNQRNQNPDLKLFEFGRTYHHYSSGGYFEEEHLALWLSGNKAPQTWNKEEQPVDYYLLKSYLNTLTERFTGHFGYAQCPPVVERSRNHLGLSDSIFETEPGKVDEQTLKKFGIKGNVFYADLNWNDFLKQIPTGYAVKEVVKFPHVTRDLALIIDKSVQFALLKEIAMKTEKDLLKEVSVFDVYEGDKIENGKKSYALRFKLQNESRTLVDNEIDKVMQRLVKSFQEKAGAEIRNS